MGPRTKEQNVVEGPLAASNVLADHLCTLCHTTVMAIKSYEFSNVLESPMPSMMLAQLATKHCWSLKIVIGLLQHGWLSNDMCILIEHPFLVIYHLGPNSVWGRK